MCNKIHPFEYFCSTENVCRVCDKHNYELGSPRLVAISNSIGKMCQFICKNICPLASLFVTDVKLFHVLFQVTSLDA